MSVKSRIMKIHSKFHIMEYTPNELSFFLERAGFRPVEFYANKNFTWRIDNNRITTKARNNAISAAENRMGKFLLVYSGDYTPLECLSIYRDRDSIEKAFRTLKTDLDTFPMRKRKESTIRGTIFVFFLSLIMRNALTRGAISSGLMNRYSLERMLLEFEKLHVADNGSGNITELERTKKQKDILDALEKVSWW